LTRFEDKFALSSVNTLPSFYILLTVHHVTILGKRPT